MRRAGAAALAIVAQAALVTPARAQSRDDVARADALFREGTAFLSRGNDADACDRFAKSRALLPGVGVTLYLADCLQRIGRTASAWQEFREAEALATEKKDKRAALAHHRAAALSPVLDRVTIDVAPGVDPSVQVTLDGAQVAKAAFGTGIPVDPGHHVVVARAGGAERFFEAVVGPGSPTAAIAVAPFAAPAPEAASSAASPSAPAAESADAPSPPAAAAPTAPAREAPAAAAEPAQGGPPARLWVAIGLAGLGVAGVAVGAGFGLAAKSALDQSNAGPCGAGDLCDAKGLSLRQDALHDALASTVAFAVGGAALGASAVVAFVLPQPHDGARVTVSPTAGGAAASVAVAF